MAKVEPYRLIEFFEVKGRIKAIQLPYQYIYNNDEARYELRPMINELHELAIANQTIDGNSFPVMYSDEQDVSRSIPVSEKTQLKGKIAARTLNGRWIEYQGPLRSIIQNGILDARAAGYAGIPNPLNYYSNESAISDTVLVDDDIEDEETIQDVPEVDTTSIPYIIQNTAVSMKPQGLEISDLKWKYLIRSILSAKNIMMVGPAGSGKTLAGTLAATALNRPFFSFNLGATQDPRSSLIGNTQFSNESGTFFSESAFISAITTPNAVILLDELSRAHPEAWNILMTVLDLNQRYVRLDEKVGAPIIRVAQGVSFIATANIGSEYTSTRVLDRALTDRFVTIEMDVLTPEQEANLLSFKFPAAPKKLIAALTDISNTLRQELVSEMPKVSTSISTRAMVEIVSIICDGFTLEEAAEVAIYPMYDSAGIDSERAFVKQLVQKYANDPSLYETPVQKVKKSNKYHGGSIDDNDQINTAAALASYVNQVATAYKTAPTLV